MEWLVEDWLPSGRVSMLTGEGGAGKSRLALQLAAGIVTGGDGDGGWIDAPIDRLRLGPSVGQRAARCFCIVGRHRRRFRPEIV